MKRIVLLVITVLASVVVNAQPGGGGGGMGGPGMGGPGMMPGMEGSSFSMQDPAEQAQKFVDKMKDSLQIDDKQEKTLVKLYTNHFTKLQTLKAQISDLEKYTEQRLTTEILTQEQAEKWKTMKKSMRGRSGRDGNSQNSGNSEGNFNGFPGGMPPMGPGGPGM